MFAQDSILLGMAGSAIFTVGLLSLCAHFASTISQKRVLLWFGLFAAPYGLALVARGVLAGSADDGIAGGMEFALVVVGKLIGFVTSIPALLLFREFYGKGWRLSSKWLIWTYAIAVVNVFILLAIHEQAKVIPSPGITLVLLVPLMLLVDRIAGYRPPEIAARPVMFWGLAVFFLTFSYDRLSHLWMGGRRATTEPFGFLILTICLGYVVSRQVATKEAEWLSMTGEMQAARRIQLSILPSAMPTIRQCSIAARYAPMTAVAGDFFGFPQYRENSVDIIVADVMGHGVPAALIASMVKVSIDAVAKNRREPHEIMGELNDTLCQEAPGQFVTAVYVSLDQERGIGAYSAGGHPPPYLWRKNSQMLETLDARGLLLGVKAAEVYQRNEFRFHPGDRLLLYSDGLTEAENGAGASFGDLVLPHLFASRQSCDVEQFADSLLQDVLAWSDGGVGTRQSDDITFVVIDLG